MFFLIDFYLSHFVKKNYIFAMFTFRDFHILESMFFGFFKLL